MPVAAAKANKSSLKRALKKDKENQNDVPRKRISISRPEVLHTYLSHEQVNQYLKFIDSRYSQFVKLHTIGLSYEHREIRALEINWNDPKNTFNMQNDMSEQSKTKRTPDPSTPPRNIVFIEAGTHAREWITISVALSCIYQLIENHKRHIDILRKLRFFIVPCVNPDGYEFSRLKNRKWRKNRRPHRHTSFIGTDCNRNYDFHWENGSDKKSNCTYKGEKPFSEPETRAMRDILEKLGPQILFFLSLHSCGQSIMYPWGYTKDESPDFFKQLEALANAGKNAIMACNAREYRVGSISQLVKHCVPGSIVDYAHGHVKIPLALVMELPSRTLGFQPPKEMISPLGYESWFGIREMCRCAYLMGVCWDNQKNIVSKKLEPGDTKASLEAFAKNFEESRQTMEERLTQQRHTLSTVFPRKNSYVLNAEELQRQQQPVRVDVKSAPPKGYSLPINMTANGLGTYKLV